MARRGRSRRRRGIRGRGRRISSLRSRIRRETSRAMTRAVGRNPLSQTSRRIRRQTHSLSPSELKARALKAWKTRRAHGTVKRGTSSLVSRAIQHNRRRYRPLGGILEHGRRGGGYTRRSTTTKRRGSTSWRR